MLVICMQQSVNNLFAKQQHIRGIRVIRSIANLAPRHFCSAFSFAWVQLLEDLNR